MAGKCEECGCLCARCTTNEAKLNDMHLHAEIENLRQRLVEKDSHIVTMETQFLNEADKFPNGELASMKEDLRIWQEKYSRLCEAHKRVQKVNQNLEDKLLRIVDKCETEKGAFAKDIATLSHRLADANYTIHHLTQDNEKYRNDVNLAIQLLQCKPSNFVGQKYDSLPSEVQAKVRSYVSQKRRSSDASPSDVKSITVPISTFPPTAMVYNITKANVEKHSDDESDDSKPPVDIVSAAIMAKVLEDRERERIFAKHCDTCTCHRTIVMVDSETQTTLENNDLRVCDHCGSMQLVNDRNLYDSVNGTLINSQIFNDTTSSMMNFRRVNDTKLTVNRRPFDNSYLDNSSSIYGNANVSIGDNNMETQTRVFRQTVQTAQKHSQHSTKQKSSQNTIERTIVSKANINKAKQSRLISKRIDTNVLDARTIENVDHWAKYDKEATLKSYAVDKMNTDSNNSSKEPSPVEIINDRIWKSEWSNAKSQLNAANETTENRKRDTNSDTQIDVINDRVWKNDSTVGNFNKQSTQMTVIEVTNAFNATNPRECGLTETAVSPSFSSDSVVISTSNQSSSSSDALHTTTNDNSKLSQPQQQLQQNTNKNIMNNNVKNGNKTNWKERSIGPRNCFMRVTPGSKNILLDNVGHYQTVLYTSGGTNRPNTALVHVAKSTRSARSMSTSSEENSPIVTTNDNTQLQRVAEWVQSSVGAAKTPTDSISNSRDDKNSRFNTVLKTISKNTDDALVKIDIDENIENTAANAATNQFLSLPAKSTDENVANVESLLAKSLENPFFQDTRFHDAAANRNYDFSINRDNLDLISFENCNTDEKTFKTLDEEKIETNYDVKITKEMEEIYLKLAASLDPVSLRFSETNSEADITIEKYRKDHRKIHTQKIQDKSK